MDFYALKAAIYDRLAELGVHDASEFSDVIEIYVKKMLLKEFPFPPIKPGVSEEEFQEAGGHTVYRGQPRAMSPDEPALRSHDYHRGGEGYRCRLFFTENVSRAKAYGIEHSPDEPREVVKVKIKDDNILYDGEKLYQQELPEKTNDKKIILVRKFLRGRGGSFFETAFGFDGRLVSGNYEYEEYTFHNMRNITVAKTPILTSNGDKT